MNELEKILRQLQEVAPEVIAAAYYQIQIEFYVSLTIFILILANTIFAVWMDRRSKIYDSLWQINAIFSGCILIVSGIYLIVSTVNFLNPDLAVYRMLIP